MSLITLNPYSHILKIKFFFQFSFNTKFSKHNPPIVKFTTPLTSPITIVLIKRGTVY